MYRKLNVIHKLHVLKYLETKRAGKKIRGKDANKT